jgi:kinesin family protein 11
MKGFNCTIFAYGQTGTGKTYTMEGGGDPAGGTGTLAAEFDLCRRDSACDPPHFPNAQRLAGRSRRLNGEFEHSVRVSHLELYNEELIDLLCTDEKQLKLFDDGNKGVRIANLEEALVSPRPTRSATCSRRAARAATSTRRTSTTARRARTASSPSQFT